MLTIATTDTSLDYVNKIRRCQNTIMSRVMFQIIIYAHALNCRLTVNILSTRCDWFAYVLHCEHYCTINKHNEQMSNDKNVIVALIRSAAIDIDTLHCINVEIAIYTPILARKCILLRQ